MNPVELFRQYQELQAWVGWSEASARRVAAVAALLEPHLAPLVDDFYEEIRRHPGALKVITEGQTQIDRLKKTLVQWLRELLAGHYDQAYVDRRWRVGWRHVEIGLNQVYANVALARLRTGLVRALHEHWQGAPADLPLTVRSLNKLLDLDLAIIEHAYQAEYAARAQRNERLATIGQVAGGVAHELRNPLNVIQTSVYYLLNARDPTAAKQAEHLQRIEKHVVLADGVITALTNFAKMPIPSETPFALGPFLQEVLDRAALPATVAVALDCPPALPPVRADVEQIRIVFANLLRNAREAMPQGGRLTITCRRAGAQLAVAVSDSGVGIAPDLLQQVLEPLYSTKAKGLGLGVPLARAILEKNKGFLRITSELGHGSTFAVYLPAARTQEEACP